MATFQERLNEALELRHISAAELSRNSGVNEGAISQYRKGKYKASQDNIEKIAKCLNVSIPWLMGVSDTVGYYTSGFDSIPAYKDIRPIETRKIPLVGKIACGEPVLSEENFCHYVEVGCDIRADFCVRCSGDSMYNARIYDGDIVFIAKQPDVENGEIAAVAIDDAITLKRVYKGPGYIELRAENPKYKPIIVREDEHKNVRIIGKAVAFQADVV